MDTLPSGVRSILARFERLPLRAASQLLAELATFEARLGDDETHHPFADTELALRAARHCRLLLADPANEPPERLRLIQLAVDYLTLTDDAESDRDSILGFDDDAQVFDAIAKALGRWDLTVGDHLA